MPRTQRDSFYDGALVLVNRARFRHDSLVLEDEIERLTVRYPNSGLSKDEMRSILLSLADEQGVPLRAKPIIPP
jgi:hypothetical protein